MPLATSRAEAPGTEAAAELASLLLELSLLVLPLVIPVLILGAAAIDAAVAGFSFHQHLLLLSGMALGALVLCPWVATASLRQALE